MGRPLSPDLLGGPVDHVAPRLLNTLLVVGERVGRVVEVEAYGGEDDPASHAARGRTPRNSTMFGRAGLLYVYRSYGVHWCANIVTGDEGTASAVLLRALEPVSGLAGMRRDRPRARRDTALADGPGKLCAAMGITGDHDGVDLLDPRAPVRWRSDGRLPPSRPHATPRVGISKATERRWRFVLPEGS